ncbi:MAG TPA: NAD(P)/FAD-dependent oxidoreductase [Kofleriaceae bacterium]|nr:NAD(P)/FAD-dependent oxidoreductase [Kofleriaceae bacterium]
MDGLNVGVIGCGTAGAAAALLLARGGNRVTILERVREPGPVGAGIVLQPTGQAVLARLGLLAQIEERGARLDRLWCRTSRGRTLVDLAYARVEPRWFGIGIHRGVLFESLYRAACAEPGVTVQTGVEVRELTSMRPDYDLIVIADGAVSELRDAAAKTTRDAPYRFGALWFVGRDPDRIFTNEGELYQVAVRARRLYGALPTGLGPHGDTPLVSLFWSLASDQLDAFRSRGLDAWKDDVRALDPRIAPVLDQIRSIDDLVFARYRDVRMSRWIDRGVVFIGDAAHATSPQLGQGANLALLDAYALADAISSSTTVDHALQTYTRTRRGHLRHYQRMTRWLTPFFQSDSKVIGWLRDWLFPLGNALPPVRGYMIRTMSGVRHIGSLRALTSTRA